MLEKTENEFYLCKDCSRDVFLTEYIIQNAKAEEICTICLENKKAVKTSDDKLLKLFSRFLIRYHYPEYEYNRHFGGEDLPHLFYNKNLILNENFKNYSSHKRDVEIENFLYDFFDLWNDNNEIDLYYGHSDRDGTRGMYIPAIKEIKSLIWQEYKRDLLVKNSFLIENKAKDTFKEILENLKFTLDIDSRYYRARIGYKEEKKDFGSSDMNIKVPYKQKEISSPPILKAPAGRVNRQGISYLYLASNIKTAIGEVRPHPGHYLSIGEFTNIKKLNLADLRFINLIDYFLDKRKLKQYMLLKDLSNELSLPILPNERENYLVTQFISDIIRQLGFDGILFKSSISKGHNLVVFDSENFQFKENSSELFKITTAEFGYKKTEYEYDIFIQKATEK